MLVLGRTPCDVDAPLEDRRNEIVLDVCGVIIRVYLLKNNRGFANRVGIDAPLEVKIVRGELYNSPTQEGRHEEAAP